MTERGGGNTPSFRVHVTGTCAVGAIRHARGVNRTARRTVALLYGDLRALVLPWVRVQDERGRQGVHALLSEPLSKRGERRLTEMSQQDAIDVCIELLVVQPRTVTHALARVLVENRDDYLEVDALIKPLRQLAVLADRTEFTDELRECAQALVADGGVRAVWGLLVQRSGWQFSWRRVQELRELAQWDAIAAIAKSAPVRDEHELLALAEAVSA